MGHIPIVKDMDCLSDPFKLVFFLLEGEEKALWGFSGCSLLKSLLGALCWEGPAQHELAQVQLLLVLLPGPL